MRFCTITRSELGHDFIAYRNHVYRVVNLCAAIGKDRVDLEKIAVAAVFHDLGIWTNKTFDYIAPSVALAREYLAAHGRAAWIAEIERMIADHHKITPSHANKDTLTKNRNCNLLTSKAPLESQAQGTSLFTSAV